MRCQAPAPCIDDAQLKAAATHALPTIKRHLAMAQQLAGAMKGSP
jgi:putative membrane protein